MESGSIEREIRIDAAPEIVFDVVSDPAHVQQWWADEARYEAVPGSAGQIVLTGPGGQKVPVAFQVVNAVPHRPFSSRWTHPEGEQARESSNSLPVTFELEPAGDGTLLRMTETGFRERGWEAAVIEKAHREHCAGWDHHLPRLAPYVAAYLGATR
jgi:uncharacterized protein YndB with AHSA1/START domain